MPPSSKREYQRDDLAQVLQEYTEPLRRVAPKCGLFEATQRHTGRILGEQRVIHDRANHVNISANPPRTLPVHPAKVTRLVN